MASNAHSSAPVDYEQLNIFSSVVLYDSASKSRKKGKIYQVERIIGRKKEKHISANVIFDAFTSNKIHDRNIQLILKRFSLRNLKYILKIT